MNIYTMRAREGDARGSVTSAACVRVGTSVSGPPARVQQDFKQQLITANHNNLYNLFINAKSNKSEIIFTCTKYSKQYNLVIDGLFEYH